MNMFCRTHIPFLTCFVDSVTEVPFCEGLHCGSVERSELNMASIGPPDLSSEDYSSVPAVYSSTLPSPHIQTVISSYNSSISKNVLRIPKICNLLKVRHVFQLFNLFHTGLDNYISHYWVNEGPL